MKLRGHNPSEYFSFLNYLKALGIIALMLWHSEMGPLNSFVILYFLQMFFFISGVTFKDEYAKKPILFVKKRVRSLYIPFIGYCLFFLLMHNLFAKINIYGREDTYTYSQIINNALRILILKNTEQLSGAMWFIIPLIVVSVLFCGLSYLVEKVRGPEHLRFALVMALFILGNYLIFRHRLFSRYFALSLASLIFYYLGYLYRRYRQSIPLSLPIAIVCMFSVWLGKDYGIIEMSKEELVSPPFFLYCGIAGIYFNLYIAQVFEKWRDRKILKILNFIGENTMIILALHFLAFKFVHMALIAGSGQSWASLADFPIIAHSGRFWYLYTFAGLAIPLFTKRLIQFAITRRNRIETDLIQTRFV